MARNIWAIWDFACLTSAQNEFRNPALQIHQEWTRCQEMGHYFQDNLSGVITELFDCVVCVCVCLNSSKRIFLVMCMHSNIYTHLVCVMEQYNCMDTLWLYGIQYVLWNYNLYSAMAVYYCLPEISINIKWVK